MSRMLGVRSDATDDYDSLIDMPDTVVDSGYAAVFHDAKDPDWSGPTDFYRADIRAPLAPDESKTWAPIYLWADPRYYTDEAMFLSFQPDSYAKPPGDRTYTVELLYVPDGITGAPDVGTTWNLDPAWPLRIGVPTYATENGLKSYQFAMTISAVPEPTALACVLLMLGLRRRR